MGDLALVGQHGLGRLRPTRPRKDLVISSDDQATLDRMGR